MQSTKVKMKARERRHKRVRKKVKGSKEAPRLCVYRSSKHIYAQAIDDIAGQTLAFVSSRDPSLKGKVKSGGNTQAAKVVGELIAKKLLEIGVSQVIFDRGGYLYHGRVKALADGAREKGLKF